MKPHHLFLLAATLLATPLLAQSTDLRSSFLNPAPTRPGCYWYWINDNISKEQKFALPPIHNFPEKGGSKPIRIGPDFTAKDFQDVSVFAFPRPQRIDLDMKSIPASSPTLKPLDHLFDGSAKTSVQITPKPQITEFTLEIHVTNTWNNRLVADASLPAKKRQSYISEGNLFNPKIPSSRMVSSVQCAS